MKEELAGLVFAEAVADDVFREKLGSSLRELVAGVGTQAEVVSVGRTLRGKCQENGQLELEKKSLPNGHHDLILLAVIEICSSQPCLIYLSADVSRFDSLRIDEDLFRIDVAHIHFARGRH